MHLKFQVKIIKNQINKSLSPENDLWPSQPRQASVSSDHWGSDPDRSMAPPRDLWRPNRQGSATPEIWRQAEETIDHLIINGLVPASDMTTAGKYF